MLAIAPNPVFAQVGQRLDAGDDAEDARADAIFAMPDLSETAPLSNLYSTSTGLEEQIPSPQLRANVLFPFGWNSNPDELSSGGTSSWKMSPLGNISLVAPIGSTFRFTASGSSESDRYFSASEADRDKLTGSARLQYVDPSNDQAISPYVAITPRWEFEPTFSDQVSARQDFNIGFNKRFNFDGSFQPIPRAADTAASAIWSLGLTVFAQRRLRESQLSSDAVYAVPSVSYLISKDWKASLGVELLGRWYERDSAGVATRMWEAVPVGTLEYVIPASLLGGEKIASFLGRPKLDLQGSYDKVWSTAPGASFDQLGAAAVIKMGWRF
jgi:hypothetical protein